MGRLVDKYQILKETQELRRKLQVPLNAPIDLKKLISNLPDITLVYYPFKSNVSGMTIKEVMMIVVNSNETLGRQNFSLAHELYHLFYQNDEASEIVFDYTSFPRKSVIEQSADLFASHLLISDAALEQQLRNLNVNYFQELTLTEIIKLEQSFRVSRKALLTRLLMEKLISETQFNDFSVNVKNSLIYHDVDHALYEPTFCFEVYGQYELLARKLFDANKISEGKLRQYYDDIEKLMNITKYENESQSYLF